MPVALGQADRLVRKQLCAAVEAAARGKLAVATSCNVELVVGKTYRISDHIYIYVYISIAISI